MFVFYILFNEVERVYAAIWFMHVCKIWDNDLTDWVTRVSGLTISLWNFKKPLDIFSPQIEEKVPKNIC